MEILVEVYISNTIAFLLVEVGLFLVCLLIASLSFSHNITISNHLSIGH